MTAKFTRKDLLDGIRAAGRERGLSFTMSDRGRSDKPSSYITLTVMRGSESGTLSFRPQSWKGEWKGRGGSVVVPLAEPASLSVTMLLHGWRLKQIIELADPCHPIEISYVNATSTRVQTDGGRATFLLRANINPRSEPEPPTDLEAPQKRSPRARKRDAIHHPITTRVSTTRSPSGKVTGWAEREVEAWIWPSGWALHLSLFDDKLCSVTHVDSGKSAIEYVREQVALDLIGAFAATGIDATGPLSADDLATLATLVWRTTARG